MKKLLFTALCIVVVLSMLVISAGAQENSVDEQLERLNDLAEMLIAGTLPTPFNADGTSLEIPNINLIAFDGYTFTIGLEFAGIPADQALIAYAVSLDTPLLPKDFVLPDICPVWGDDRRANQAEDRAFALLRMGNMITVDTRGMMTAGHPLNATGARFFTTAHIGSSINGRNVFHTLIPGTRIGTVESSFFAGGSERPNARKSRCIRQPNAYGLAVGW